MVEAMFNIVQDAMYYFIDTYGLPWRTLNVKIKVHPIIFLLEGTVTNPAI